MYKAKQTYSKGKAQQSKAKQKGNLTLHSRKQNESPKKKKSLFIQYYKIEKKKNQALTECAMYHQAFAIYSPVLVDMKSKFHLPPFLLVDKSAQNVNTLLEQS
jgi:hypothetical protein